MYWHEEMSDKDVSKRLKYDIDPSVGGEISNENNWHFLLQKFKDKPEKRFEAAIQGLPLPYAFSQAALGLRAMIKDKIKNSEGYEDILEELYTLAVWQSYSMKRSERAETIGYNILQRIPGGMIASINCDYQDIGYKNLELINKTDAKRLVAIWGEPKAHTTLLEYDSSLWMHYEDEFIHIIKTRGYRGLYNL